MTTTPASQKITILSHHAMTEPRPKANSSAIGRANVNESNNKDKSSPTSLKRIRKIIAPQFSLVGGNKQRSNLNVLKTTNVTSPNKVGEAYASA